MEESSYQGHRQNVHWPLGGAEAELAQAVLKAVMEGSGVGEDSISISIEDVAPLDWTEKVYKPDIETAGAQLYKRPGYGPLGSK